MPPKTFEVSTGQSIDADENLGFETEGKPPKRVLLTGIEPGSWAEQEDLESGDELLAVNNAEIAHMSKEQLEREFHVRPLKMLLAREDVDADAEILVETPQASDFFKGKRLLEIIETGKPTKEQDEVPGASKDSGKKQNLDNDEEDDDDDEDMDDIFKEFDENRNKQVVETKEQSTMTENNAEEAEIQIDDEFQLAENTSTEPFDVVARQRDVPLGLIPSKIGSVFVHHVRKDTWAARSGIKPFAEILAVNNRETSSIGKAQFYKELQGRPLKLTILAPRNFPQSEQAHETENSIESISKPLGFTLCDMLPWGVMVHEVIPGSWADKAGIPAAGDIQAINGVLVEGMDAEAFKAYLLKRPLTLSVVSSKEDQAFHNAGASDFHFDEDGVARKLQRIEEKVQTPDHVEEQPVEPDKKSIGEVAENIDKWVQDKSSHKSKRTRLLFEVVAKVGIKDLGLSFSGTVPGPVIVASMVADMGSWAHVEGIEVGDELIALQHGLVADMMSEEFQETLQKRPLALRFGRSDAIEAWADEDDATLGVTFSPLPPGAVFAKHVKKNGWAKSVGMKSGAEVISVNGIDVEVMEAKVFKDFVARRPFKCVFVNPEKAWREDSDSDMEQLLKNSEKRLEKLHQRKEDLQEKLGNDEDRERANRIRQRDDMLEKRKEELQKEKVALEKQDAHRDPIKEATTIDDDFDKRSKEKLSDMEKAEKHLIRLEEKLLQREEQLQQAIDRGPERSDARIIWTVVAKEVVTNLGFVPAGLSPGSLYVSRLQEGGWLEGEGLLVGDELTAINDKDASEYTTEEVDSAMQTRPLKLTFTICNKGGALAWAAEAKIVPANLVLRNEDRIIGFTMAPMPPGRVFVRQVKRGTWAEKHAIYVGDELVAIDGIALATMEEDVFQELWGKRPLRLQILPSAILDDIGLDIVTDPLGLVLNDLLPWNIYVTDVKEGSYAQKAGVVTGSEIVAVNERPVTDMSHYEFKRSMRQRPLKLRIRLSERDRRENTQAGEIAADETVGRLGMDIVDALPWSIFVENCERDGWAERAGITPGSTIVAINGNEVRSLTMDQVYQYFTLRPVRFRILPPLTDALGIPKKTRLQKVQNKIRNLNANRLRKVRQGDVSPESSSEDSDEGRMEFDIVVFGDDEDVETRIRDAQDARLKSDLDDRLKHLTQCEQEVFRFFDFNCSGNVSYNEFRSAMAAINVVLPNSVFWQMVTFLDPDNAGHISYDGFHMWKEANRGKLGFTIQHDSDERALPRSVIAQEDVDDLGFDPAGLPPDRVTLARIQSNGWADMEDLESGDELIAVNQQETRSWTVNDFRRAFSKRPLELTVIPKPKLQVRTLEDEEFPNVNQIDVVASTQDHVLGLTPEPLPPARVFVKRVQEDSWASIVGLMVDDEIVAVNNEPVSGMLAHSFKKYFRQRPLRLTIAPCFQRATLVDDVDGIALNDIGKPIGLTLNDMLPWSIFVERVDENGWAAKNGMADGSEIRYVNGMHVSTLKLDDIKREMRKTPLSLKFVRREAKFIEVFAGPTDTSLGMVVETDLLPERLRVTKVNTGAWAENVGIQEGTDIETINGVSILDLQPDHVMDTMKQRPLRLGVCIPVGSAHRASIASHISEPSIVDADEEHAKEITWYGSDADMLDKAQRAGEQARQQELHQRLHHLQMCELALLRAFDRDQLGNLSHAELRDALTFTGVHLTDIDFKVLVMTLDPEQNGFVPYGGFHALCGYELWKLRRPIKENYRLSYDEVRELNLGLQEDEFIALVSELDRQGNGFVPLGEYLIGQAAILEVRQRTYMDQKDSEARMRENELLVRSRMREDELLARFERDHKISYSELREAHSYMKEADFASWVKHADLDADGFIDKAEYLKLLNNRLRDEMHKREDLEAKAFSMIEKEHDDASKQMTQSQLREMYSGMTDDEFKSVVRELPKSADGTHSMKEFIAIFANRRKEAVLKQREEDLVKREENFFDHKGPKPYEEFRHLHPEMTDEEFLDMMRKIDVDASNSITMEEYLRRHVTMHKQPMEREQAKDLERERILREAEDRLQTDENAVREREKELSLLFGQLRKRERILKERHEKMQDSESDFQKRVDRMTKREMHVFQTYDTDHSGSLTLDEFRRALIALDWELPDSELLAMIREIDSDENGAIDYEEFLMRYGPTMHNRLSDEQEGSALDKHSHDARIINQEWQRKEDDLRRIEEARRQLEEANRKEEIRRRLQSEAAVLTGTVQKIAENFARLGAGISYWSARIGSEMRKRLLQLMLEHISPVAEFHPSLKGLCAFLEEEHSILAAALQSADEEGKSSMTPVAEIWRPERSTFDATCESVASGENTGVPPKILSEEAPSVSSGAKDQLNFLPASRSNAVSASPRRMRGWGKQRAQLAFAYDQVNDREEHDADDTLGASAVTIESIFATRRSAEVVDGGAFAALLSDGSVISWGKARCGGNSDEVAAQISSGVQAIFSSAHAFAALKDDGTVCTWGSTLGGGEPGIAREMLCDVREIFSNDSAFVALKADGSLHTWGAAHCGGDSSNPDLRRHLDSGVKSVTATVNAFAALKNDGSVHAWGHPQYGGNSGTVADEVDFNVSKIYATTTAFAAVKFFGSVHTWGSASGGGDSYFVKDDLKSEVQKIFSTTNAFAALKKDGSVITWGHPEFGGDSEAVRRQLSSKVHRVFATNGAFAALRKSGSVCTWGHKFYGGDSSSVRERLRRRVQHICSTARAFAAVDLEGCITAWGNPEFGGDATALQSTLERDVRQIYATSHAFAVIKRNGSVHAWGHNSFGGDCSAVQLHLESDVRRIYSTACAFAALKGDGSVYTWGSPDYGGDSEAVRMHLSIKRERKVPTLQALASQESGPLSRARVVAVPVDDMEGDVDAKMT